MIWLVQTLYPIICVKFYSVKIASIFDTPDNFWKEKFGQAVKNTNVCPENRGKFSRANAALYNTNNSRFYYFYSINTWQQMV